MDGKEILDSINNNLFMIVICIVIFIVFVYYAYNRSGSKRINSVLSVGKSLFYSIDGNTYISAGTFDDTVIITLHGKKVIQALGRSTKYDLEKFNQPNPPTNYPLTEAQIQDLLINHNSNEIINCMNIYEDCIVINDSIKHKLNITNLKSFLIGANDLTWLKTVTQRVDSKGNPYISTNNPNDSC